MVMIVAITEGVDLGLLLQEKNRLPWWNQALKSGNLWRMKCGPAPYEPPNLASAFTGYSRGHHGCYSYWSIRSERGNMPRVLESSDVQRPWIWHWPELADMRFAIVNLQLTYPPQALNGFLISYPMNQTLRYTYPSSLAHDLKHRGLRYGHDVSVLYRGEPYETFFRDILRIAEYQLEVALALSEDCDVLVVNLTIADRLSHFLWHELEQAPNDGRKPYILQGYHFLDEALAQLDKVAGDDPLLIFSEVGFGPIRGFVSLDKHLQRVGFQLIGQDCEVNEESSVAREAVQGSHGIILTGKTKGDKIAAGEVRDYLLNIRDTDGFRIIAKAWLREEIYEGPSLYLAPDIVVEPADPARPPLGDPRWARHVNRSLQTGWHRDEGFVLILRAQASRELNSAVTPESIAPTIAALTRREPPARCVAPELAFR